MSFLDSFSDQVRGIGIIHEPHINNKKRTKMTMMISARRTVVLIVKLQM